MHKTRKNRLLIIGSLLSLLLMITVGYAIFETQLEIKGKGRITSNWDIRITNVTAGTPTGNAENTVAPTWTDLTANMEANLYSKGDAMDYDVTISNRGTLDAKLDDVIGTPSNNAAVIITFSGYVKGEVLPVNGDKIIHVKIAYNPDYNGGEASGTSQIEFIYIQDFPEGPEPGNNGHILMYNYTANKGNSTTGTNTYLTEGTPVNLTPTATKQWGWTFTGWNTDQSAHTGLQSLSMPNQDTTIYALFSKTLTINYEKTENVDSISKATETCTMYNSQVTCQVTLPTITPKTGYEANTWYYGKTAVGSGGATYNVPDGNYSSITLVTGETANAYTVTYDYAENGGTSATKTTDTVDFGDNIDLTPTATKDGYQFVGWNTDPDAHTGLSHTPDPQTMPASNVTLYAIYKKPAVTLTAKFNANNATLSSTDSLTCTIPEVYNKAVQATTCTVTAPTITAPTNTPDVIGFNNNSTDTTNNSQYNASTGVLTLNVTSDAGAGRTWYAITKHEVTNRTITFYRNENTNFIYNGATYTDTSKAFTVCTIPESYNGTAQATSCTVSSITMPTITAHANTPTIIGWSTGASVRTATYTSGQDVTNLVMSSNLSLYAQTRKAAVTLTAKWNANGATLSSTADSTCSLAVVYNGAAQATSCTVDAPTITRSDFTITGFNTTASATTNNSSYNTSTKKLTLTSSNNNSTWYAITSRLITVNFQAGTNTASVGAASRTCTIQNSATTCNITTPTITPNSGYFAIGFNVTAGAAKIGYPPSTSIAVSSDRTYNGNSAALPTFSEAINGEVVVTYPAACINASADPTFTCTYQVKSTEADSVITGTTVNINDGDIFTTPKRNPTVYVGRSSSVTAKIVAQYQDYTSCVGTVTYNSVRNDFYIKANSTADPVSNTLSNKNQCEIDGTQYGYGTMNCPYTTLNKAYTESTTTKRSYLEVISNITQSAQLTMGDSKTITIRSCTRSGSGTSATCTYDADAGTDTAYTVTKSASLTTRSIILNTGSLTIGKITFDGANRASAGGFMELRNGTTLNVTGATTIKRFKSSDEVGNGIWIRGSSTVNMSGGTITANGGTDATQNGAGIYVAGGSTLNKTAGNITNNTTSGYGGGVMTYGTFTHSGGNVSDNTAEGGGGIYCNGTLTFSGGNVYSNNATNGAGITTSVNCDATLSGGSVYSNTATNYAGGVRLLGSASLEGTTIRNNSAAYGGGGTVGGPITIKSGNIYSNTASSQGGGLYLSKESGTVTMTGGNIYSNTSYNGGGVYLESTVAHTFVMNGTGQINSNTASNSGGGVFISSSATFKLTKGTVKNNKCTNSDGTSAGGITIIGTFTKGTAANAIICGNTPFNYTLNGTENTTACS